MASSTMSRSSRSSGLASRWAHPRVRLMPLHGCSHQFGPGGAGQPSRSVGLGDRGDVSDEAGDAQRVRRGRRDSWRRVSAVAGIVPPQALELGEIAQVGPATVLGEAVADVARDGGGQIACAINCKDA